MGINTCIFLSNYTSSDSTELKILMKLTPTKWAWNIVPVRMSTLYYKIEEILIYRPQKLKMSNKKIYLLHYDIFQHIFHSIIDF